MLPTQWRPVVRLIDRVHAAFPNAEETEFRMRFAEMAAALAAGGLGDDYAERMTRIEAEHALIARHFRFRAQGWRASGPPPASPSYDDCPHCGGTC